ncbi:MAG TPA: DMT family transporter [Methylomirabilota bacterium]|nr:DMT family transporter [Methylomirabilota bacterium]
MKQHGNAHDNPADRTGAVAARMRPGAIGVGRAAILLVVAIALQAGGNVCLSMGMKQLGSVADMTPAAWVLVARTAVTSPTLLVGIGCLAGFFFLFGYILARVDLSVAVPVISLEVAVNVAAGHWILGEQVSALHWLGTALVTVGVALVGLSARPKLEHHL